jgi:hypothetical protein
MEILIGPPPEAFGAAYRQLYSLMGNEAAQCVDNTYVTAPLEVALAYCEKALLGKGRFAETADTLENIHKFLVPGCLPAYEARLQAMLMRCRKG